MFAKDFSIASKETIGARDAKAFRESLVDATRCAVVFPYLSECAADLRRAFRHDAGRESAPLEILVNESQQSLIPKSATLLIAVAAHPPFQLRPDLGTEAQCASATALLLVDGVPLGFLPLLPRVEAASEKTAKAKSAAEAKTLNASTVALPSLQRGPWLPTIFLCCRVAAMYHQLRYLAVLPSAVSLREGSVLERTASIIAVAPTAEACSAYTDNQSTEFAAMLPPYPARSTESNEAQLELPAAACVPAPASLNVMRGADVMLAGVRGELRLAALRLGNGAVVKVLGNPIPFAVGYALGPQGHQGKAVRVLHSVGDALWRGFLAEYASCMKHCGLALAAAPATPLGIATLLQRLPTVVTGDTAAPATNGGGELAPDESTTTSKKQKPIPKRALKAGKGDPAEAKAVTPTGAEDPAVALVRSARRFLPHGQLPAGFAEDEIFPLPRLLSAGACSAQDSESDVDVTGAAQDTDTNANGSEAASSSDDGETASIATTDAAVPAPEDVTFPTTPDDALLFALCESVMRLSKTDLPVSLGTFTPRYLLRCLPPTYWKPTGFDWAWTTYKRPLAALSDPRLSGLITIAPIVTGNELPSKKDSGASPATPSTGFAVTAINKNHTLLRQHKRRFHASGFLSRNGVVLAIDRGVNENDEEDDTAASAVEMAAQIGARRIARVKKVAVATQGISEGMHMILQFTPTAELHGDRVAAEAAQLPPPPELRPGTEVDQGAVRKRLNIYARAHRLHVLDGPADPVASSMRVLSPQDEKAREQGGRRHASAGDLRLDDVLQYFATRAPASEGYRGESFASRKVLMAGMLRECTPALKLEFADGGSILHKDPSRWVIWLEKRLIRNHWQTWCHNLQHFGLDLERCVAKWPALLACSVEMTDAEETARLGGKPAIIVHGRNQKRLIAVLTNTVGVPADCIHHRGRK
jgi:hypothetical protein